MEGHDGPLVRNIFPTEIYFGINGGSSWKLFDGK